MKEDLRKYRVILFKGQHNFTAEQQVKLSKGLGVIESTFYKRTKKTVFFFSPLVPRFSAYVTGFFAFVSAYFVGFLEITRTSAAQKIGEGWKSEKR